MRQLLLLFLLPAVAAAHPYSPLHPGDVSVYSYRFRIIGGSPDTKALERSGKMIVRVGPEETRGAHRYLRVTTSYENVPGDLAPTTVWKREFEGALLVGSEVNGKWIETIELPVETAVGATWEYFDGERSRRAVTKLTDFTFGGKKYTDCIEVSRQVIENPRMKDVLNTSVYCSGLGEVKFLFRMPSRLGDYVTETNLVNRD